MTAPSDVQPSETAPGSSPTKGAATATKSRAFVWPLAIFSALALVFALALQSGDPSRLPSALIGKPVPALDLQAVDGLTDGERPVTGFGSADLTRGQVSVVNFWASWCVPCVEEHPMLMLLKERTGVRVFGINYKDQAAAARRFLGRYGNPFAAVGTDGNGRAAIEWGVYGMPETFVVKGKGQIAYKHVGPITAETLETKLIPAIRAAEVR
jgi:cytochrome c biogenesis protein CcmG, thiol:disulfide interchange protein DsbE